MYTEAYLALPVLLMFYIAGYAWKRKLPQRAHEINIDSGRKSWYTVEEMNAVCLFSIHLNESSLIRAFIVASRAQPCAILHQGVQKVVQLLNFTFIHVFRDVSRFRFVLYTSHDRYVKIMF